MDDRKFVVLISSSNVMQGGLCCILYGLIKEIHNCTSEIKL